MTMHLAKYIAIRPLSSLLPIVVACAFTNSVSAADLTVTISPVKTESGAVNLAIYDSEGSFRKTETVATRKAAVKGDMVFSFPDLASGEYAIMVYHDINSNDKLDANLLGMPKEPWGGSLQGKSVFGAPGWSDTRFTLTNDGKSITITLN